MDVEYYLTYKNNQNHNRLTGNHHHHLFALKYNRATILLQTIN